MGLITSNPAERDECGQVFAVGVTSVLGFRRFDKSIGAVALGGAVGEPAKIVGPIFERWLQASKPPLDRGELCTRDLLGAVGLAVDQDEYDAGRWHQPALPRSTSSYGGCESAASSDLGAELGA